MGRVIAIDYGTKKVGIAATDEAQLIASPLTTIASHDLFPFLKTYTAENDVECIVIGEPKKMSGEASEIGGLIENLKRSFKNKFPEIPVVMIDERFTSNMAKEAILARGANKKKRQDKTLVDRVSATIILQSYMEKKKS